jgi:hypothetical protein
MVEAETFEKGSAHGAAASSRKDDAQSSSVASIEFRVIHDFRITVIRPQLES